MANYLYINETGVVVPDTATLLGTVQGEYKGAFGTDLNTDPQTPQGMLITGETLARDTVVRNNSALANQINPNEAGGVFLDAIWALTGGERDQNQFSQTVCNLAGVPATIIPIGVTIKNSNGDIFASTETVILTGEGTAVALFKAILPGPITAPAGTLNTIVQGVLGWETVTNPDDASIGVLEQSDESSRLERRQTLALQGQALPLAISSGLYKAIGVANLKFRENVTDSVAVIDDVTMQPHSMYACVFGGTDLTVATVLLEKKSGGCNYSSGAANPVTVDVLEPTSGQIYPVSFDRPDLIGILIKATVHADTSVGDPTILVTAALLAYADGLLDGEPGFTVGTAVSCFELAGAINRQVPGLFVTNLQTSLTSPVDFSNAEIPIAIFEKATTDANSITVVLG